MKFFYLVFFLLCLGVATHAQQFSLPVLVELTGYTQQKFQSYVEKKKFRQESTQSIITADVTYSFTLDKKQKEDEILRSISFQAKPKITTALYQTSSLKESIQLRDQLKKSGYKSSLAGKGSNVHEGYFQKDNFTIETGIELRDSIQFYTFSIQRRELPKHKEIVFAEDLLQITSHEYLVHVFGATNVVKDIFYYSEKETNKCSVLFPKSNREVVFIWDDEENYRKTSFLVIGGHLQTGTSVNFNSRVQQNLWQSEQGVYPGMSLGALQSLNESSINFYSWQMEEAGVLTPKNTGKLNFERISLVLNCLNCFKGDYYKADFVSSDKELLQDRKVYVSTMIILPEKEKASTALR